MTLTPPQHSNDFVLTFPSPHVLLLTLNRPHALNSVTPAMGEELRTVLDWFEAEDELWVLVVTGTGRMFCTGMDLKNWNGRSASSTSDQAAIPMNQYGFASLSRRLTAKPIIAAANGGAFGGGMELLLNCDLVVAADDANFALPEVRRGVSALQGGIPRLVGISGHQRAAEMLLLGRHVDAKDAFEKFRFINFLKPKVDVIPTALGLAKELVEKCSPDSVQTTKRAMLYASESDKSVIPAVLTKEASGMFGSIGDAVNMKEGLKAFVDKRAPLWKNPRSKL